MRHRLTADTSRPSTQKRLRKEGRGQGHGRDYKSYLDVRSGASHGNCWRLNGWKVGGRVVHLFSSLERDYFYNLEADSRVVEYKEQFPLPLERTRAIADSIGVSHPKHPQSKGEIVMTTDFVVRVKESGRERVLARAIKPSVKLENERTLEKLEIERLYWLERGVNWEIRTERDIDAQAARTMQAVHPFFKLGKYFMNEPLPSKQFVAQFRAFVRSECARHSEGISLVALAANAAKEFGVSRRTSLILAKHLICRRDLPLDARVRFEPTRPLIFDYANLSQRPL